MKNKILMGLAAIAMVAFLSSCGKVPQAQIDATQAAIDSAKVAEANVYAAADFTALLDSMKSVNAAVEVQKGKMFKNFKAVKATLDQTIAKARQVTVNAGTKKAEVKKEVETLMTDIKAVVAQNVKYMKLAPRGKEGAQVLEQMKAEMTTIDASIVEAQGLYDKGAFMDALNKVKASKDSSDKINAELVAAFKKAGRALPK
jgi:HSP90 family molecular chaperone